VRGQMTPITTS